MHTYSSATYTDFDLTHTLSEDVTNAWMLHTLRLLHKHTHADVTHNFSDVTHSQMSQILNHTLVLLGFTLSVLDTISLHETKTHSNEVRQKEFIGKIKAVTELSQVSRGSPEPGVTFPLSFSGEMWQHLIGSALCLSLSTWFILLFLLWPVFFSLLAFRSSEPSKHVDRTFVCLFSNIMVESICFCSQRLAIGHPPFKS